LLATCLPQMASDETTPVQDPLLEAAE
jgi:hypothetical protein